jgi:transcription elongation factor GreB
VSRAFVKEDDGDSEPVAPRLQRQHPYYVTPDGLTLLQGRLAEARAAGNEREIEDLQERLEAAVVVDPAVQDHAAAHFGARVTVEDPQKKRLSYRIVGEDEADPLHGTISWRSPLAQALEDHRVGDRVIWQRPAGNLPVRIVEVSYE